MSLSDISSLTEFSSDEEYAPVKTTKKKTEKGQYKIKPILNPPRQTTYSAKALFGELVLLGAC